jgi:hypothetical protein
MYSAKDWMVENKLLIPTKREQKDEAKPKEPETITPQPKPIPVETESKSDGQQPESTHRFNEVKECVRPNVFLYRSEIEALKREYTDSEINKMLDILSDYKRSKNREYASDYDAIKRWVYKRVNESTQPARQKTQIPDLPDWVFSKET